MFINDACPEKFKHFLNESHKGENFVYHEKTGLETEEIKSKVLLKSTCQFLSKRTNVQLTSQN